ncbi:MAG: type I methionyl aminopeptidase [Kiritimatiellae bacterium]|nr:type I methionyl aminopeptidase [Kiritimatiellia bacterium]
MIIIKSESEIEAMRASGHVAGVVRNAVADKVSPGVTTMELADYASELMKQHGAESAFLGYRGFPGQICISVNNEVVHGIPGKYQIKKGDIVSLDVGVTLDGFIGDTATTVMVEVTDQEVIKLVESTEKALFRGIEQATVGGRLSDISYAIEDYAVRCGFYVVRDFVGHGIGRSLHEDPQVPNFGNPGKGPKLRHGMIIAIEPMLNVGCEDVEVQSDGWTVSTKDGKLSAHFEHTVLIADSGFEILTL